MKALVATLDVSEADRRPKGRSRSRKLLALGALLTVWALGALWFFRAPLMSHLRLVNGDVGDTRLLVAILEHWRLSAQGSEPWRSPSFFYPQLGVLGYSDALFLMAIPYVLLRAARTEEFAAFQITIIFLSLVGFASFYWISRRIASAPRPIALVGALLFTFSNANQNMVTHAQMLAVWFLPVTVGLAHATWQVRQSRPRFAVLLSGMVGLSISALLFTSFYVAWFAVLLLGFLLVVRACIGSNQERRLWWAHWRRPSPAWPVPTACLAGLLVGSVPFVLTYRPVWQAKGGRTVEDALPYVGSVKTAFDVGPGNWLWSGHLYPALGLHVPAYSEHSFGTPPLGFLVLVCGTAALYLVAALRRETTPPSRRWLLSSVACCFFVLLMSTRQALWLWPAVFHLVPGAPAIRAVARAFLLANSIVTFGLVALGTVAYRANMRSRPRAALVALCALAGLVLVEQVNTSAVASIDRTEQIRLLDGARQPSRPCAVFAVAGPDPGTPDGIPVWVVDSIDAMLISQRLRLPTVNGYSGEVPDGWNLTDETEPNYSNAVRRWLLTMNRPDSYCVYDLKSGTWRP